MSRSRILNPHARTQRATLRLLGAFLAVGGLVFAGIGFADFFGSYDSPASGMPERFWCVFLGLPMLAIGIAMLRWGYLGAMTRYAAGETAPVASDTVGFVGAETRDTVRDLAGAVREGLDDDGTGSVRERLEQLERLRRDGLIDDGDFEEQKDRILRDL